MLSDPHSHSIEFHLNDGSIHRTTPGSGYSMIDFQQYNLRVVIAPPGGPAVKSESEMTLTELLHPPASFSAKQVLAGRLEFHSRLALPFACLVFMIIAMPLGIQNRRSGKAAGFSLSIGVILLYYVALSAFKGFGEKGTLPPFVACWAPNFLFLAMGAYLFKKTASEQPLPWAGLYPRLAAAVSARLGGRAKG